MSFIESTGDNTFRVYIQLSAGMRPGAKADEVRDIVEGLPFNVRALTLDIDVGFRVEDYPEESDEWMEAMKPLRRAVAHRGDLEYLRLSKHGWRDNPIFEAFVLSAQDNPRIRIIEVDRLLLSASLVSDWMSNSPHVNQFIFNYVRYDSCDAPQHDDRETCLLGNSRPSNRFLCDGWSNLLICFLVVVSVLLGGGGMYKPSYYGGVTSIAA